MHPIDSRKDAPRQPHEAARAPDARVSITPGAAAERRRPHRLPAEERPRRRKREEPLEEGRARPRQTRDDERVMDRVVEDRRAFVDLTPNAEPVGEHVDDVDPLDHPSDRR